MSNQIVSDRFRNYCFTINNYTLQDIDCLVKLKYKYLIYGDEISKTGTSHLQGFIIWSHAKSFKATLKLLPERSHIEICKGSAYENFVYCSKTGKYTEYGFRPQRQGERKDMKQIKSLVSQNITMRTLLDQNVIMNYQQLAFAEKLSKYYEKVRTKKPEVIWYYGETGTGKSFRAYQEAKNDFGIDEVYFSMDTSMWFDGYDAHKCVIIDDMRKDFMKFHLLLKLLDAYPYRVQTKGSTRQFVAERIYITAPVHPAEMYFTREDVEQLLRRITKIELLE